MIKVRVFLDKIIFKVVFVVCTIQIVLICLAACQAPLAKERCYLQCVEDCFDPRAGTDKFLSEVMCLRRCVGDCTIKHDERFKRVTGVCYDTDSDGICHDERLCDEFDFCILDPNPSSAGCDKNSECEIGFACVGGFCYLDPNPSVGDCEEQDCDMPTGPITP